MITWNWKRPDSDEPLTKIRADFVLGADDLVNLLCCHWQADPDAELSAREIEKRIREQLSTDAHARFYWHERNEEAEAEELEEWAREQLAKLPGWSQVQPWLRRREERQSDD